MTKRLDKAIEMLRQLSPAEQDAIAVSILDQITGKPPGGRTAEATRPRLDELVAEADREIDAGETQPLGCSLVLRLTESLHQARHCEEPVRSG